MNVSRLLKFGHRKDRHGLSTPVVAILATFIIAVVVTCLSLMRTAREANLADNDRTALAVSNALHSQIDALAGVTDDNAYWDTASRVLHADVDSERYALDTWGDSSLLGTNYDCVLAVDATGRVLFTVTDGQLNHSQRNTQASPQLKALTALALNAEDHGGSVMRGSDGLRIAGVARMRSSLTPDLHPVGGRGDVFLILSKRVSRAMLAQIGNRIVIDNLRLAANPTGSSIVLRDSRGDVIGHLAWHAALPGNQALSRSIPFLGLAFVAGLLTIALLLMRTMAAMHELGRIALIDSLSGLPNRRALRRTMNAALHQGQTTAIAFIDLDGFKGVNDNFGHAVGDELIRECATLARKLAPPTGLVARLGGDEFAILAIGERADDELCASVDAMLLKLRETFHIGERTISIGASIGLASSSLGADRASELMRQADIAMYAAKRSGKMRRLWFTPEMDRSQAMARAIELKLHDALDAEQFEVRYQPIFHAQTGVMVGIEGLLRWEQPGLANVGPDQFIPVAEETGLIDRLGQFVLRRALRDAADWDSVRLSVNVSSAQLRNPEFPGQLKQLLDTTGFPAARLELEVTETYVVVDPVMAARVLSDIRHLGVRLALDDFGTGYASIGFLRKFAFDTLKIDKSLIADAVHDPSARAMLHASIAVARALNMATVAEGIENEAQAIFMRAAGCDYLQGWLYSRAVDARTIGALLVQSGGELDTRIEPYTDMAQTA